ncbi:Right handed beta helix region [Mariniphaga anaerophila]|uniref:Right handed beta helix region n=1 Tax=Mariniphaga anaerophila TaxID=1484053 RepID=A0A1M4VSD0_9BACT|nr:right-handed parallel beta-helix repeat-containing protein [Mariniphaga anaerophila]SHE71775.1 Right handed beta helix region [Mariniphaga anaerophila]
MTGTKTFTIILFLNIVLFKTGYSSILKVPEQYKTIQEAVKAATQGDTVLVANGVYHENFEIAQKDLTLTSNYIFSNNKQDIRNTVINGSKNDYVINVTGPNTTITGFTIENGSDGVSVREKMNFTHNIVRHCSDGLDYESNSGGLCQNNIFELNSDDGIDLDDDVDIVIERNIIRTNKDDGIEIRLQHYSGDTLNYEISHNLIVNNGEDGIQLIGYPEESARVITIQNNIIANISMAAIGCMSDGNTKENFEAAPLTERIYIYNNTIASCSYGICGGGNSIVLNNSISNIQHIALKGINQKSIVAYQNVYIAEIPFSECNLVENTILSLNPMLNTDYSLSEKSPLIDRGISEFTHKNEHFYIKNEMHGKSPDIGAIETGLPNWAKAIGF